MSNLFTIMPADRLKAARRTSGFSTAKQFALEHNIPIPTYSAHESGRNPIRVHIAKKYSKLLNVSPEWLLHGDTPVNHKSNDWNTSLQEHLELIADVYNYFAELLDKEQVKKKFFKIILQISFEIFQQTKNKKITGLTPALISYINKRLKDLKCLKTSVF